MAYSGAEKVLLFIGVEIGLYLVYKILRQDVHYWIPGMPLIASIFERIVVKVIVDFTGCIHLRHPYELGGLGFTISLVWAQAFPLVALQYFDGKSKDIMTAFLAVSFMAWMVLNVIFFCTIDLSYLNTFFGTKTAAQYTCERFLNADNDSARWSAAFGNRMDYKKAIQAEIREWISNNIEQWKNDKPDWFVVEKIPDEYLPKRVFEAEGGAKRRRSSVSMREIVGWKENIDRRVHP